MKTPRYHLTATFLFAGCTAAFGFVGAGAAQSSPPLIVLIIDGQNNHDWKSTTPVMKRILEDSGFFTVDVATSPPAGANMSGFSPDLAAYPVVLMNYNGDPWPQKTRDALVKYMNNGGGLVVVHAADNSFPEWPEYNRMIGLGGWGNRDEKAGPYIRLRNGKFVPDTTPGQAGSHGKQHEYKIIIRDTMHPITKGLPREWIHAKDELYDRLRGPAQNLTVLATAYSDTSTGGTGEHEPMLMTIRYGKGRVFHTALGHDGTSMSCVGFITTLLRGTEWAATGKVSHTAIPADFPAADRVSVQKIAAYKFGDSRENLSAVQDMVRASSKNKAKRLALEKQFAAILQSDATFECKDFICRQLWIIGTKESAPVLKAMLADDKLADMARYALERNPAPEAGKAFRDVLAASLIPSPSRIFTADTDDKGTLNESLRYVGIINSIGERRDRLSVPLLGKVIGAKNEYLASAAASALGKIGGPQATAALTKAKTSTSLTVRAAAENALRTLTVKPRIPSEKGDRP